VVKLIRARGRCRSATWRRQYHYNVSQPIGGDTADSWADGTRSTTSCSPSCCGMGGRFSAGTASAVLKRDELPDVKDKVAIELMRANQGDARPLGLMNPARYSKHGFGQPLPGLTIARSATAMSLM